MNILAVDSSSQNLSFTFFWNGKILVNFNRRYNFGASKLVFFIDKNLKKFHISLKDFDLLAVGCGPGSFTGLRISFSVIKAFNIALKKPVISVPSFYLMAHSFARTHEKIAVIADAKRGLVYGCSFRLKNGRLIKEQKEKLTILQDFVKTKSDYFFITYDESLYKILFEINPKINCYTKSVYPQAKYALSLAEDRYKKKKFVSLDKLEPLYLHHKTCQIRKPEAR